MNPLLQGIVCTALVLCVAVPAAESGVNECRVKYNYWHTSARTVRYTQRYTVRCGLWGGCRRERQASYTKYYSTLHSSYRTECCTGWRRNRFSQCRIAICSPSCVYGTCIRPNTCQCRPGFTGSRCSGDIDECQLQSKSVLKCNQMCINSIGSYRCDCDSGFVLDSDRHTCNDIDECLMTRTHNCPQLCDNNAGSYKCYCYQGYMINPDGVACDDQNECDEGMACQQICENTRGYYKCSCMMGYTVHGRYCEDINECDLDVDDCSQDCTNSDGHYKCSCYEGYELGMDGKTCFDIDECASVSMNCDMIRLCQVAAGQGSNCSYVKGPLIKDSTIGTTPLDFNCTELQICSQNQTDLTCACVEAQGHALSNVTDFTDGGCINANSSDQKLHLCRFLNGQFSCDCVEGYQLIIDNYFCRGEDIHDCNSMQDCKNTPGGYECPCKDGYINNTETGECDDINECSTDYMNCPDIQICNTINSTITCECLEGRVKVRELGNCDGCTGLNVCNGDTCNCYQGYFLNSDNRPCEGGGCGEMIHDCAELEACKNTIGGYECPCMNGFLRGQGVNATCDDIDECRDKTDGCHHLCMNLVGSYSCACVEGYILLEDNHTCVMPMAMHEAYLAYQEYGDDSTNQVSVVPSVALLDSLCCASLNPIS